MNPGLSETHPSLEYYDSDYPSRDLSPYPENFDETTKSQGLYRDVERFLELAAEKKGPLLELCCGTGRVAIQVARAGFDITAVDISASMLAQFKKKLDLEPREVAARVNLLNQDVTQLALGQQQFSVAICPFNSLMCIPEANAQQRVLQKSALHVRPGGTLMLDLVNPFVLNLKGDPVPKPFYTRKNVHNGNLYTRFAAMGVIDADQVQELHGWYDQMMEDGLIKRLFYSMKWRILFPNEIRMMLDKAGFVVQRLEGDHDGSRFTAASPKMNVIAEKKS